MTDRTDVIFVGLRRDALRPARARGLRALLVEERPVPETTRQHVAAVAQVPFDASAARLRAAVEPYVQGGVPRALVAAGERGVLAAARLREALGIPGTDPDTARRARDKVSMKRAVRDAGVPCTDWIESTSETCTADIVAALGLPAVFKERSGAGSRGVTVARTWADVEQCLDRLGGDPAWMVERFVQGEEMSVESFVVDGRVVFANCTEYFVTAFANIAPAALAGDELAALLELNARALAALGIRQAMTHLELYRTATGPVFGEVAVRPPGGRIMRLLRRAYGFDPWDALLHVECGEPFAFPERARRVAGVWMLHPGGGRVARVQGFDAARRGRGVRKLVCRVEPGTVVAPRASTGSDVGWIEVSAPSRDAVARRLTSARQHLRVVMEPPEEPEA